MEEDARSVMHVPDRAPTVPELLAFGGAAFDFVGHRDGSQGAWRPGCERMSHQRNVCCVEKRGLYVDPIKRGEGTKILAIANPHGLHLAVCTAGASSARVTLRETTVPCRFLHEIPECLIRDNAYYSIHLDRQLGFECGIEVIAPHRNGRRQDRRTQNDQGLRRYTRRWKAERMFSWMLTFKRLVAPWEYDPYNFVGFTNLAMALILLKHS